MAENEIEVKVKGDASDGIAAMEKMRASVTNNVAGIKANMKGLDDAVSMVRRTMVLLTGALAGGAAFRDAVNSTVTLTKESVSLGKQLGISASQASILKMAMGDTYVTQEQVTGAANKLTQTLRTNEDAFGDLGVTTRDNNGNFRSTMDIMSDVNKRLLQFKEGTDRNIEGQKIYGRSWTEISNTLKLTQQAMDDAAAKADALHLVVGEQSVEATARYRAAMNDVGDVIDGFKKAVGDALLPVLSDLGEWLSSVGPKAVQIMRGAVFGLVAGFHGLVMIVKDVWATIKAGVESVVVGLLTLADVAQHALAFDFSGAKAAWQSGMGQIRDIGVNYLDQVTDNWEESQKKIGDLAERMFSKETPAKASSSAGSGSSEGQKTSGDERYGAWVAQLQRIKEVEGDAREKDISADIVYWQQKLALVQGNGKEDVKLRQKIGTDLYNLRRKLAAEERALDEESVAFRREMDLAALDNKAEFLRSQRDLGLITAQQELAGQRELEQERYQIEQQSLQDRLALAEGDRVARAKIMDQMTLDERQHRIVLAQIDNAALLERDRYWASFFGNITRGFQGVIANFLKGTATLSQTMRGLLVSVGETLAQTAAKNIATMLAQAAAGKAIRAKEIMGDAKAAAAGAYKAVVGIPYVGPILAPPAAAAAFAGVMAFSSAAKGYDIPAGVNPMTQLHEKEMVLPSKHADVIRGLAEGGGAASAGGTMHVSINTIDSRGMEQLFKDNYRELAKALTFAVRSGYPVPR